MSNVLLTGGAGYIGSHVAVELLNLGFRVAVIDNLTNSSEESLKRVEKIAGKKIDFYNADLRNKSEIDKIFDKNKFDSVIHFAALKAVGESVAKPLLYYENNIFGTLVLLGVMQKHGVKNLVYSSSATVYGDPHKVPITEDFPIKPTNPYGYTKSMTEQILRDLFVADKSPNTMLLRYFNPVGAHKSGLIGEDPGGVPNNLVPYIAQVAVGKLDKLKIFGNDYDTPDGTGVRDYIHVTDLAIGHIKALQKLDKSPGIFTYNLGTGRGYSVLEVIGAFEKASGVKIKYEIVARRPGDIASCYADPSLANKELGWSAQREITEMCEDVWRWQSNNPNGYK